MKTDKFDDAIRQKLESIEPPFRERDWSHMQAFMHRHGYPPAWAGASQWLVPLAAAASVTGLIISTVWQFHTNQQLSQSLQTLSQTVARLETTQAKLINSQNHTDTVYVTNFTKSSIPTLADQPVISQPVEQDSPAPGAGDRYARQYPDAGTAQTRYLPRPTDAATDRNQRNSDGATQRISTQSNRPGPDANQPVSGLPTTRNRLAQRTEPQQPVDQSDTVSELATTKTADDADRLITRKVGNANRPGLSPQTGQQNKRSRVNTGIRPDSPETNQSGSEQTLAVTRPSENQDAGQRSGSIAAPTTDNQSTGRQSETIDLLNGRPMAIDSAYYLESIARRTRRIRSLLPTVVTVLPPTTASTDVASSRPAFGGIHIRLGGAGEIGNQQRTAGAYGEVLIGSHWLVGIGLNRSIVEGGRFENDNQYKRKTKKDFPQPSRPGYGPPHDIASIDRQYTLWQLPVSLGYRALLGNGFTVTPLIGINFGLSAQERITFTSRPFPFSRYVTGQLPPQSRDSTGSYTVALMAEKSWKHIVFQAGPVLSAPTKPSPDPINPLSVSLRTRILFQF